MNLSNCDILVSDILARTLLRNRAVISGYIQVKAKSNDEVVCVFQVHYLTVSKSNAIHTICSVQCLVWGDVV